MQQAPTNRTPHERVLAAMAMHKTFIAMRDELVVEADRQEEQDPDLDTFLLLNMIADLLNFSGLAAYAASQAIYSANLKRGRHKADTMEKSIEFTDLALNQLAEHAGPTIYSYMKRRYGVDPFND